MQSTSQHHVCVRPHWPATPNTMRPLDPGKFKGTAYWCVHGWRASGPGWPILRFLNCRKWQMFFMVRISIAAHRSYQFRFYGKCDGRKRQLAWKRFALSSSWVRVAHAYNLRNICWHRNNSDISFSVSSVQCSCFTIFIVSLIGPAVPWIYISSFFCATNIKKRKSQQIL